MIDQLPIFPLTGVVLFPSAPTVIHVFEPRYLRMVDECTAAGTRFGICLAMEAPGAEGQTELAAVGTTAEIEVAQDLDNNQKIIFVRGHERFRVVDYRFEEPDGLMRAEVVYFNDDPACAAAVEDDLLVAVGEQAIEHFRLLREYAGVNLSEPEWPRDPVSLSLALAAMVPFGPTQRQALLELTDTRERLRLLHYQFARHNEILTLRQQIDPVASRICASNGRFDHVQHLDPASLDRAQRRGRGDG